MKNIYFLYSLFFFFATIVQGQAQVAKASKGTFALTNATIITVTKDTITNGTLIIQNGKIAALGTTIDIPSDAQTIDCTGQSIYPGMIDSGTQLGMAEVLSLIHI